MRTILSRVTACGAFAALAVALPAGPAAANHVQFVNPPGAYTYPAPVVTQPAQSVTVVPAPTATPATVTVVPAPTTVVVPVETTAVATPLPQTLRTEQIRAHRVQARAIYANRIETDRVQGVVHHISTIAVGAPHAEIVGPDVATSVIYADSISANSVIADDVYVRDLEMSPSNFVIAPFPASGGIVVRRQSP